jgi:hypothetical protein
MVRFARNVVLLLAVLSLASSPALLLAQSPGAESPAAGSPGAECPTTTAEENEAIFEQYIEALDSGDEAQIEALLHDEFSDNQVAPGGGVTNAPGNDDELENYRNAGGEALEFTIEEVFAADDLVAVRYTFVVPPGLVAGSTATEPISVSAIGMGRIECGMLREAWVQSDTVGLLLGSGYQMTPPAGAAPSEPAASPAA